MQENEFEKRVQQKMEELKLVPSGAVWQKIEPQIRRERRRRWVLVLIPLLIAFLYGGYEFLNSQKQDTNHQSSITKNNTSQQPDSLPSAGKNLSPPKQIPVNDAITENTGAGKTNLPAKGLNRNYQPADLTQHIKPNNSKKNRITTEKVSTAIKNPGQAEVAGKEDNSQNIAVAPAKELTNQSQVSPEKDSLQTKNGKTVIEEQAVTAEAKKITKNTSRWRLGISFAGGVSSMANSFLEYGQQHLNSYPSSAGVQVPGVRPSLSAIKPATAFMAALVSEKKLFKKVTFTTGITYKLFSTTNRVGSDSGGFFGASAINKYHNFYHYLEVPAGFKLQLASRKREWLYWNAGFSVSQLIAAKALQFDYSRGVYYHDNSQFNKTIGGIYTGLDLAVSSKQKNTLLIGPYFNYSISKIASQGYNKYHFTFLGVSGKYFFDKK